MGARADEHDPTIDPVVDAVVDAGAEDIPVQRRRERLLADLDTSTGRGLEIGPLFSPLVLKTEADVEYVDVHGTAGLRDYYRDHAGVPVDRIVQVDHVLYEGGRLRSVREAATAAGPVAWVVASHVVEHVPDVVGWLADLADAVADGGRLALVVPDRRYTFDATRVPTTVGEMLDAHDRGDQRPSLRAVYDYFSEAIEITAHDAWRGAVPTEQPRTFDAAAVRAAMERHRRSAEYIDCHAWVWTPAEFVSQLGQLFALGMLDFVVDHVRTTPANELEFYVVLRRLPRDLSAEERGSAGVAGFDCVPDEVLVEGPAELPVPPGVPVVVPGRDDAVLAEVSDREWLLLKRKRALMSVVRRVARTVRA